MRLLLCVLMIPAAALAQNSMPTEFPSDATTPSEEVLVGRVAGQVYRAKLTDGATWRLEYKANGYVFLNTGSGFSDTGKWSIKKGQLCTEWGRATSGCVETRATSDALFIKRSNTGEVVALRPE